MVAAGRGDDYRIDVVAPGQSLQGGLGLTAGFRGKGGGPLRCAAPDGHQLRSGDVRDRVAVHTGDGAGTGDGKSKGSQWAPPT